MVDAEYLRGCDDCLEVVLRILRDVKSLQEFSVKILRFQALVKDKKFEKLRMELCAFNLF